MLASLQLACLMLAGAFLLLPLDKVTHAAPAKVELAQASSSVSSAEQELLAEELRHAQRLARLLTIRQLAAEDDYADVVTLADQLIEKEYKRHNDAIDQLRQALQSNVSDANSVWWKDVGKTRDANSSSRLGVMGNQMFTTCK